MPGLARSGLFWRMMGGALIAFIALLLTAGLSLVVINSLVAQTRLMVTTGQSADQVMRFADSMDTAYDALNLLNNPNYQARFYVIAHQNVEQARQGIRESDAPADPQIRQTLRNLLQRYDNLNDALTHLNATADENQAQALGSWQGPPDNYRAQFRSLVDDAHHLAGSISASAQLQLDAIRVTQNGAPAAIVSIAASGLLLGMALTLFFLRRTALRIRGVSADLGRLANGDLRPPRRLLLVAGTGRRILPDEVHALEQDYLKTIRTLSAPLERIQRDASRISASALQINGAAVQQAASSNQQATAITEVTVTAEELDQTAVQIAEAAGSVAIAAEQALVSAGRGQEAVRDPIIGMAMIRSRVNDITARILALSGQSQRISEIIDVIDEMAARTHILALNAAVESAGAGGEVGERFGVVASEVKKLAQRSAAATREVRIVIGQVQAATNAAVMATEDGLKETEKGVQVAHQSGDANEDIIQMVERTAQLANAISLATQQQRTASEQVVASMREVAHGTRQAAAGSQQAAEAANDLSSIAQALRVVSQGFRTADQPAEGTPPVAETTTGGHRARPPAREKLA